MNFLVGLRFIVDKYYILWEDEIFLLVGMF